jgi:hypothetical protein
MHEGLPSPSATATDLSSEAQVSSLCDTATTHSVRLVNNLAEHFYKFLGLFIFMKKIFHEILWGEFY